MARSNCRRWRDVIVAEQVGKLRELEDAGDAGAKKHREEFDDIRQSHDVRRAQDFEARIPTIALELELISKLEQQDLQRLQDDRHRCAHPSQTDEGSPYAPTDELGRAHLRAAVESLLRFPPAQGKAALARVQAEIDSPYFPEDIGQAVERLRVSPLGRGRRSLIRNAAVAFVKAVLDNPLDDMSPRRRRGLAALWQLHPSLLDEIAQEKLLAVCASIDDARLINLLFLVRAVPHLLGALRPETRDRLNRFVDEPNKDERYVNLLAITIDDYRVLSLRKLFDASEQDFVWVVTTMGPQMPSEVARVIIDELIALLHVDVDLANVERLRAMAGHMVPGEYRRFFNGLVIDGKPQIDQATFDLIVANMTQLVPAEREFNETAASGHFSWDNVLSPF